MNITIAREFDLTDNDIKDILSTAFDDGINYWCKSVTINKIADEDKDKVEFMSDVLYYDNAELLLTDSETPESWVLTKEKVANGFKQFCEEREKDPERVLDWLDADDADSIIQYALFNEIIFA